MEKQGLTFSAIFPNVDCVHLDLDKWMWNYYWSLRARIDAFTLEDWFCDSEQRGSQVRLEGPFALKLERMRSM